MGSKIWRVENEAGNGPYMKKLCCVLSSKATWQHPSPFIEFSGHKNIRKIEKALSMNNFVSSYWGSARCGFRTKNIALCWFSNKELRKLRLHGFYLVRIEVARVLAHGKHQSIYIPLKGN